MSKYPLDDQQFQEHILKSVKIEEDGYVLETMDSGCLYVTGKEEDFIPQAGMTARFYGKGFGYPVRGVFVNGIKFYYRTEEEEKKRHQEWVESENTKKQKKFEETKADTDKRVAQLPEVFQRRLERFRRANPDFRWQYEPYELFCCEQAVKNIEGLQEWKKKPWDEQKIELPELDDGHSGNTFGASVTLAYHFLTNPENVILEHGALVPLVGCKEYGCEHPYVDEPIKVE